MNFTFILAVIITIVLGALILGGFKKLNDWLLWHAIQPAYFWAGFFLAWIVLTLAMII